MTSPSDGYPGDEPTIDGDAASGFSDVEGARLFEQVRSQLFGQPRALTVGRYRILRRIGAGAMAEVQLGVDEDLDRLVAIKFVHVHLASHGWAERMRVEARALARLAHPNVVHVYEVGEHQGHVYLAMEYIEGSNLREWICPPSRRCASLRFSRSGIWPPSRRCASRRFFRSGSGPSPSWEQVLAAYLDAGRGLAAAHGAGVIHRDFKPENVLRGDDGRIAVADFGLAALEQSRALVTEEEVTEEEDLERSIHRSAIRSRTDEIKGTPAYMPPEQFRGRSDARADQFALCVSLYEGLWGERPFARLSIDEAPGEPTDWIPRPPPRQSPVPGWLWPILRRGLAYDPADRWPSVDELLAAIERRLHGRRRRARWLGSGAVALGVGVLSGVGFSWWRAPEPIDACATLEGELEGTWDAQRREQLSAAFSRASRTPGAAWLAGTAVPVIAGLDAWRERWLDRRNALCRARVGGDRVILDRVGACLEHQRRSTAATVELLLAGEVEVLSEAPLAVQRLADPRACEREARQGGPPEPPRAIAAEVERLRAALARIEASLTTGAHQAAHEQVEALTAEVAELDYAPLRAELALLRGRALLASRPPQGLEVLEQAADLAEGARHDRVVAESWERMATLAATEYPDLERGRQWLRRAEAAAERLGVEPLDRARLDFVRGNLELLARELDAAIELLEPALAVFEDHGDLLHASFTASALGLALLDHGEERRAIELFERALRQREQVYGAHHPGVALAAYNLGRALLAERPELAPALLERAVEIWTTAESLPTRDLGLAHFALAQLALDQGRFAPALEHARAAAIVLHDTVPADDILHAEIAMLLATSHYFLGMGEEALVAYRQAVAGYSAAYGVDDVYTANFRVGLAWALLATGQVEEARAEFQAGLETIEAKLGVGSEDSVDARLGLLAVELAGGRIERATERLAGFEAPPLDELNLLVFELFRAELALRLDDPEGANLLAQVRAQARQIDGGEATLAVLLSSVGADR
ncbi:MAG: serine/threonine-protein kinase [Enhygromyxa sp.]